MLKINKLCSFAFAICIFFAGLSTLLLSKKDRGFSIAKIASNLSTDWTAPLSDKDRDHLREICAQPFKYLGSGAQCYAFLSSDGNYVLKFFKMKHLLPKKWLLYFPLPGLEKYRLRKVNQRITRQKELFMSYQLAYQNLKEETGLFSVHLKKTNDLDLQVALIDKNGKKHMLNLDSFEFVFQKKSQLIHEHLSQLMKEKNREGAKTAIKTLLQEVVSQCKRGFVDKDSGISHNYGFVGDQVIHFDVGRLVQDPNAKKSVFYQQEAIRVATKLERWLSEFYPELIPDLEECIAPYKEG